VIEEKLRRVKQWYANNIKADGIEDILLLTRYTISVMEEELGKIPRNDDKLEKLYLSFVTTVKNLKDYPFLRK
tara:strand:+ start:1595 stop:1813 length:219 start_codon:yes stop_codon:yes gene_type:complete